MCPRFPDGFGPVYNNNIEHSRKYSGASGKLYTPNGDVFIFINYDNQVRVMCGALTYSVIQLIKFSMFREVSFSG